MRTTNPERNNLQNNTHGTRSTDDSARLSGRDLEGQIVQRQRQFRSIPKRHVSEFEKTLHGPVAGRLVSLTCLERSFRRQFGHGVNSFDGRNGGFCFREGNYQKIERDRKVGTPDDQQAGQTRTRLELFVETNQKDRDQHHNDTTQDLHSATQPPLDRNVIKQRTAIDIDDLLEFLDKTQILMENSDAGGSFQALRNHGLHWRTTQSIDSLQIRSGQTVVVQKYQVHHGNQQECEGHPRNDSNLDCNARNVPANTYHKHRYLLCESHVVDISIVCKPVQNAAHGYGFEVRHWGL
mmetsp:Transcript_5499/g.15910  ORF Transcript_5499/g.15910 Transcript_5499/m.15910 type:complete len:294 (-) Transcript_5499:3052-3933(-)